MIRLIKNILRLALLLILGAGLLFSYVRFLEPRFIDETQLILTDTTVNSGPSGEDEDLRIAVFADVHFSKYYTAKDFQRVVERINAMEPDFVFFLGDLIDDYKSYEGDTDSIVESLSQIQGSGNKYAIFGNHDYGGGSEKYYRQIMESGGFQVLVNETVTLPEWNVTITGIDDMIIGYGDPSRAASLGQETYNIVLCHEPDVMTQLTDVPVDLMLSGHTHGGQINIPPLSESFLPPYGRIFVSGQYTFENARNSVLYVTRGLGTTKLPLRFLASPELTEVLIQ